MRSLKTSQKTGINILKILKLLLFSLLITAFCCPAVNAYYQWLDENGKKHFTQDLPPADAKNLVFGEKTMMRLNQS